MEAETWSHCVLRLVPPLLAAEACERGRGRRAAAMALRALSAVSVESRLAVAAACAAATCDKGGSLARHVALSTRTIVAFSSCLCLLCGRHVHVAREHGTCSFRIHARCVHRGRSGGMFAPLSKAAPHISLARTFLVVDAFAYRRYKCVVLDATWRFKAGSVPGELAHRRALRAMNGLSVNRAPSHAS